MVHYVKSGLLGTIRSVAGNGRKEWTKEMDDRYACDCYINHDNLDRCHSDFSFPHQNMGRYHIYD